VAGCRASFWSKRCLRRLLVHVWRAQSYQAWEKMRGTRAKEALRSIIQGSKAHGMLAFAKDEPVGWCSFGPRRDFPVLESIKAYKRNDTSDVWSITCLFIHRKWRGKGLSRSLLKASMETMKKHGVKIVEGYPVTTTKNGRRLSSSMAWTGPLNIFEELGFKKVQSTNPLKPLVRLELK